LYNGIKGTKTPQWHQMTFVVAYSGPIEIKTLLPMNGSIKSHTHAHTTILKLSGLRLGQPG